MNAYERCAFVVLHFKQRNFAQSGDGVGAGGFAHDVSADQVEWDVVRREIGEQAHQLFGLWAGRRRVLYGEAEGGENVARIVGALGDALD
jgi:hypothetical protein